MTVAKRISDLIKFVTKSELVREARELAYFASDSLKQELALYDQSFSSSQKKALEKKIKQLQKQLDNQVEVQNESATSAPQIEKLVITSIKNLLSEIRTIANETLESTSTQNPIAVSSHPIPHVMPLQFAGVKTINEDMDQFVFCLSQTIPPNLILRQKEWPQFESGFKKEFVIGITNCPVAKPFSDRRVSKETLKNASADDIEVLDAIHEFERLGYVFDLGILTFEEPEKSEASSGKRKTERLIGDDYGLRESIIESCKGDETPKSFLIRIVAESKNLNHEDNIREILKRIPFEELVRSGVEDICLDMVSCNTIEIADLVTKELKTIAEKLHIRIGANFYDGYVQNNNSFCYINPDQEKILLKDLERRLEAGEQNPTISYSSFKEKLNFPLIVDNKAKNSTVLQVLFPGFSTIAAQNMDEMEEKFIQTKPLRGIDENYLQRQSSNDATAAEESEATLTTRRIEKKLMLPLKDDKAKIPEGRVIAWSADCRRNTLEQVASSATPNTSAEASDAKRLVGTTKSASESHC